MVSLAIRHPENHRWYLSTLERGIEAAKRDDPEVVAILSDLEGFFVRSPEEAVEVLEELRDGYVACYKAASEVFG